MADEKITALTALTAAVGVDLLVIVDDPAGTPITKKITYTNLFGSFTALGQLPFPATQVPSADANTLDDYEEGTFTPVPAYGTPGTSSWATTIAIGRYTKIGNRVFWNIRLITVPTNGTASGNLNISGFPFTPINVTSATQVGATSFQGWTKALYSQVIGIVFNGSPTLSFRATGSGVAQATIAVGDIPTGGTIDITASGIFEV